MDRKEIFESLLKKNVQRFNLDAFLKWISGTDFYDAPCALSGPNAKKGTLCGRSVIFANILLDLAGGEYPTESLVLIGALSGLARVNTCSFDEKEGKYKLIRRPDVAEIGKYERGLLLAASFFQLSTEEQAGLRWFDTEMLREPQYDSLNDYAEERYPDDAELQALIKAQKSTSLIAMLQCAKRIPIVRLTQGAYGLSEDVDSCCEQFFHD